MVEIIKEENSSEVKLLVDGEILEKVHLVKNEFFSRNNENYYDVSTDDEETNKKLASLPKSDFTEIRFVMLKNWFVWTNFYNYISRETSFDSKRKLFIDYDEIIFAFIPDLEIWSYEFSFADYCQEFLTLFDNVVDLKKYCELEFRLGNKFGVFLSFDEINFTHPIKSIAEIVGKFEKHVRQCHLKTIKILESKNDSQKIFTYFDFPEKLKVPCRQYLEYFAQFLQDLGIDATSNLKEEAGKVLFSVSPTDDNEALDRIREALAIYLNLPASPISDIEYSENFALMRLQQQVRNLHHSQQMAKTEILSTQYALRLAQQNIENQDKIIHHQNSFIDNQNKVIEKITSKSIMIDSLESKEELEKFCEGFEVGKSEFLIKHFGLHLNPATVLKTAGRKILGKEENKSVLGLDEETNQENS